MMKKLLDIEKKRYSNEAVKTEHTSRVFCMSLSDRISPTGRQIYNLATTAN